MRLRIFGFLIVVISGAIGPWWLFALAVSVYILRFQGLEVLLVAALIDAYYGSGGAFSPWYTLATMTALIVVRFLKPHVALYNR